MKRQAAGLVMAAVAAIGVVSATVHGDQPILTPLSGVPNGDPHIVIGQGQPSEEHHLSFPTDFAGTPVIKDVLVKEGQFVKAGDTIMVEDTELAEKQLEALDAARSVIAPIHEAEVEIEIKAKELENLKHLQEGEVESTELLNTQLDHDVAVCHKDQAEQELREKQVDYEHQKILIGKMTLKTPVSGIIRKLSLSVGEVVSASPGPDGMDTGACDLVVNDPLWVQVDELPATEAGRLKVGDVVKVAFPDSPNDWHDATVCYLDPIVQGGTQWRTVRFTMANPDNEPAGLNMLVKLPDRVLADASMAGAK